MDSYKTVSKDFGPVLFKERKSKFYGYCFPVTNEEEVKEHIESLRKKYPSANHVCYAWQLGVENISYRANDDSEPNNSAGTPIYGQLLSFDVTNTLVAIVRIFGGVKLGVGGLISAYKETAKLTLQGAAIKTQLLKEKISLQFEYAEMEIVMRIIKMNQLEIIFQELHLNCKIEILVAKSESQKVLDQLNAHHKIIILNNL